VARGPHAINFLSKSLTLQGGRIASFEWSIGKWVMILLEEVVLLKGPLANGVVLGK